MGFNFTSQLAVGLLYFSFLLINSPRSTSIVAVLDVEWTLQFIRGKKKDPSQFYKDKLGSIWRFYSIDLMNHKLKREIMLVETTSICLIWLGHVQQQQNKPILSVHNGHKIIWGKVVGSRSFKNKSALFLQLVSW